MSKTTKSVKKPAVRTASSKSVTEIVNEVIAEVAVVTPEAVKIAAPVKIAKEPKVKAVKGQSKYELYKIAVAARKIEKAAGREAKKTARKAKTEAYQLRKKAAAERREARKINAAKIKETAAAKKLARKDRSGSFWTSKIEKRSTWAAKRIATAFLSSSRSAGVTAATISLEYVSKKFGKSAQTETIASKLSEMGLKTMVADGAITISK